MRVKFERHEIQPGENVYHVSFNRDESEMLSDVTESNNRIVRILEGIRLVDSKFWLTAPIEDIEKEIRKIDRHPLIVRPASTMIDLDTPEHPDLVLSKSDDITILLDGVNVEAVQATYDTWFYQLIIDFPADEWAGLDLIRKMEEEGVHPTLTIYSREDCHKPVAAFFECAIVNWGGHRAKLISNNGVFEKEYRSLL